MLLHINALTLFYYKIVLAVVPYKLEVIHIYIPFVIYITIYNPLVSEQIFSKSFLWYYHLQTILATIIIVGIPVPKKILAGKPIIASIWFRSIKVSRIFSSSPPLNKTPYDYVKKMQSYAKELYNKNYR